MTALDPTDDWLQVFHHQSNPSTFDTVTFNKVADLAATIDAPVMRAGAIPMTLLATTKAVVFSSPMPSTAYRVTYGAPALINVAIWTTNKTVNGFTVNVALALAQTLDYIAVQDQ
jgi:hypothetical protein